MRAQTVSDEPGLSVCIYVRTSTDIQEDSPEIQEDKCRAFCERMGWKVVDVYNDILPGKTPIERRPRFQQMLKDAPTRGVRGLIGLGFNRFLRSIKVKIQMERELHENGLFVWGIDDNLRMGVLPGHQRQRAGEIAMVNMTVAMDQYYSDFVADKIRDHHEHRVSLQLHHSGAPPFGYRVEAGAYVINGRAHDGWVPDDSDDGSGEGLTLAQRYDWIVERFLVTENMMAIANELTRLKVPPPRLVQWNRLTQSEKDKRLETQERNRLAGHKTKELPPRPHWDSSVLSDMLRSEAYLGHIAYTPSHLTQGKGRTKKQWRPGRHLPLNTPERHATVQAILMRRGKSHRHPTQSRLDVLLNQMLICGCGHAMTHSVKNKYQYRYRCNYARKTNGVACSQSMLNGPAIEKTAHDLLLRGIRVRLDEIRAAIPLVIDATTSDDIEQEIASEMAKKRRIVSAYVAGSFGDGPAADAERDSMLAPVLARIKQLEKMRAVREQPQADDLVLALENISNLWEQFPNFVRREILRAYVPGGFRVVGARTIQAEVCGVLLEADVPLGDDNRGPRPGGMRRYEWGETWEDGSVPPDEKEEGLSDERTGPTLMFPSLFQGGQLSERRDLNPRPPLPQSGALPSCATPRVFT